MSEQFQNTIENRRNRDIWGKPFSFIFLLKLFKDKQGPTPGELQDRKMCPVWVLTKDKYTLYILRMSAPPVFSWFIMFNEFFNTISSGKIPRHIVALCQSGMTPVNLVVMIQLTFATNDHKQT